MDLLAPVRDNARVSAQTPDPEQSAPPQDAPAPLASSPQSADDAQQRIAELTARIEQAREEYYLQDAPSLSDAEYDALERELRSLEAENPQLAKEDSPTRTVGGAVNGPG